MDALPELAAAPPPARARHGCKVCGKTFLCGRSLGGHMRSHVSLGDAAEVHAAAAAGGRSCNNGAVGSYGLRENPRKTRRLSDFADDDEDEEDDDGGHGDVDGGGEHSRACRECGKLFPSWRSLLRHMQQSHASSGGGGGRYRDDDDDVEVEEEEAAAEAEETETVTPMEEVRAPVPAAPPPAMTVLSALPRRKRRTMRVAAAPPTWQPPPPPPPVLSGGGFEKEPEDVDVALCLLMLSRGTGVRKRSSPSPANDKPPFESARKKKKQAGLPKTDYSYNSDDDSAMLGTKIKSRKRGSSHPKHKQQQRDPVPVPVAAPKRTRFECPGCGKAFGSYQALGGHRASHKRMNASCSSSSSYPRFTVTPSAGVTVEVESTAAPEEPISAETYASSSFDTLSPSASPDSVVAVGGGFGGKASSNVDLYYVGADHQEQHYSAAAADGRFLDLNFPPAAPEEEKEDEARLY